MSFPSHQAIDPRGTLQNMLNEGFSEKASISEKVDNALDAKATTVKIYLNTKDRSIVFADNGHGMDIEKSKEAHRINNRKERSSDRHGRFGRGGAQGTIFLTELQTASTCLSKSKDAEGDQMYDPIVETEVQWNACIEKNEYNPTPSSIQHKSIKLWTRYSIDEKKRGTVFYIVCSPQRFEAILHQVQTKQINESLVYWLGRIYYKFLAGNFKLTIYLDDTEIPVRAIHPTYDGMYTETKHRKTAKIFVYKSVKDEKLRAYYVNKGAMGFKDYTISDQGKWTKESVPADNNKAWVRVGVVVIDSVYISRDNLKSILEKSFGGYENPVRKNGEGNESWNQKVRDHLYGVFYQRNGKIVSRKDNPQPKAGDKDAYKYSTDTCHLVSFNAEMDDYFDIQVNKSRIDEANFNSELAKAIENLIKLFTGYMIDLEKPPQPSAPAAVPAATTPSKSAEVKVESTVAPTAPKPIDLGGLGVSSKAITQSTVDKKSPNVATTASTGPTTPTASARTTISAAPTTTVVESHVRHTPKSAQDVIKKLFEMVDYLATIPIEKRADILNSFTSTTGGTHTSHFKMLQELCDDLEDAADE